MGCPSWSDTSAETPSMMKACAIILLIAIVYGQAVSKDGIVPEGFSDASETWDDSASPVHDNNSLMATAVSSVEEAARESSASLAREAQQNQQAVAAVKQRMAQLQSNAPVQQDMVATTQERTAPANSQLKSNARRVARQIKRVDHNIAQKDKKAAKKKSKREAKRIKRIA